MSTDRTPLTAGRLREVLDYDPNTGMFRWRYPHGRTYSGRVAGKPNHSQGYGRIRIDHQLHFAHRLAWLYVHGRWPDDELDHRNGNRSDNRIANLREATQGQNNQNHHGLRASNTSGFRGVHLKRPGRWQAQIKVDGRHRSLGCYGTPEEAAAAYIAAKRELHPFWVGA